MTRQLDDDNAYAAEVPIDASPQRVYEALTTFEGVGGWWTSLAEGSAPADG